MAKRTRRVKTLFEMEPGVYGTVLPHGSRVLDVREDDGGLVVDFFKPVYQAGEADYGHLKRSFVIEEAPHATATGGEVDHHTSDPDLWFKARAFYKLVCTGVSVVGADEVSIVVEC